MFASTYRLIIPGRLRSLTWQCRRQLRDVLAFSARKLQPDLIQLFLLQLMQQKYIHGHELTRNTILRMLHDSTQAFGRHTGLYHLQYDGVKDDVVTTRYAWHSHTISPWAHAIPVQCSSCGAVEAWEYPSRIPQKKDTVKVTCGGLLLSDDGETWTRCGNTVVCEPPDDFSLSSPPPSYVLGSWMVHDV